MRYISEAGEKTTKRMNKVLIHPTYFPSIDLFSNIINHPCIMEVSDNFQKQTYRNRTYIYGPGGRQMLVVPIIHSSDKGHKQLYSDVKIDRSEPWERVALKTLQTAYRTSPYFEFYEDKITKCFESKYDFLLDLNLFSIETVLSCLRVDVRWDYTKEYQKNPKDAIDLRYKTKSKTDLEVKQEPYYQIFSDKCGFIPNLSVLDLLFHMGPQTVLYVEKMKQ